MATRKMAENGEFLKFHIFLYLKAQVSGIAFASVTREIILVVFFLVPSSVTAENEDSVGK